MKGKTIQAIISIWTLISFLIDLVIVSYLNIFSDIPTLLLMTSELLICWIAYQMLMDKKWGLVILTIYYGIRTINIYTDAFTHHLKSGLNMEFSLNDTIGVNIFSLIIFILLVREINKS
jgi:hypothetical protein